MIAKARNFIATRTTDKNAAEMLTHAALGAAAGVAGTLVIQGLLAATKKWLPEGMPPIRRDPGEFMVHQTERALPARIMQHIPETAETVASNALGLGYGATFGAVYGAMRGHRGSALLEGPLLGLASWAAGYLGWLPATGLMRPVWKQRPTQVTVPIVEHALYGLATATAYEYLDRLVH
jgi:hypothetical protein